MSDLSDAASDMPYLPACLRMYNETLMTSFQLAASTSSHSRHLPQPPHGGAAAAPPERVFFCAKPDLLKTTCTVGFSVRTPA